MLSSARAVIAFATLCVFTSTFASCGYLDPDPVLGRVGPDDPRLADWRELDRIKARVNLDSREETIEEFLGRGSLRTWTHRLEGGPGWEFFRVVFTYMNSTEQTHEVVRVWLEVVDARGRIVNRVDTHFVSPFGLRVKPGDAWTDTLKVPTLGAHKNKGWTWRLRCQPLTDAEVDEMYEAKLSAARVLRG